MNKIKNIVLIMTICALTVLSFLLYKQISVNKTNSITSNQTQNEDSLSSSQFFSDGLKNPDSVTTYQLGEFDIGISKKYVYMIDINQDGKNDRITKIYFENGNAHSYYKYTIELNNGKIYTDITPTNLQTTNGADCDLRQIQFKFNPKFQITVIGREMGDTWVEPTMAYIQNYVIKNNKLVASQKTKLREICDVKELF